MSDLENCQTHAAGILSLTTETLKPLIFTTELHNLQGNQINLESHLLRLLLTRSEDSILQFE